MELYHFPANESEERFQKILETAIETPQKEHRELLSEHNCLGYKLASSDCPGNSKERLTGRRAFGEGAVQSKQDMRAEVSRAELSEEGPALTNQGLAGNSLISPFVMHQDLAGFM